MFMINRIKPFWGHYPNTITHCYRHVSEPAHHRFRARCGRSGGLGLPEPEKPEESPRRCRTCARLEKLDADRNGR